MKRYSLLSREYVKIPQIYTIGFAQDEEVTRYGPSFRNEYIIHFVLSGKGYFNGTEVKKGEGFLITPRSFEHYYPDNDEPWSYLWIISPDSAMEYFFRCHKADKNGVFKFKNMHKLLEVARMLKSKAERRGGPESLSSTEISELFLDIFHTCVGGEPIHRESVGKIYFESSLNYIYSNLHIKMSVGTLCGIVGVSQQYLYRIFKEYAGVSPQKYILEARIKRAKSLLIETGLSVSQVAASVGFASVSDFSGFFTRQTGLSPTDFKNAR